MARPSDIATKIRSLVAEFPEVPARTLAREAMRRWPKTFSSLEQARDAVRYALGTKGEWLRKTAANKKHFRAPRPPGFQIPVGIRQLPDPLQFNDVGKWLVISDCHVPYHDERALLSALEYGVKVGCKHVCINGDFYDFHQLSQYERDPESRNTQQELDAGRPILEQIRTAFKGRLVYKIGNHDDRYERKLASHSPELAVCDHFRLAKFLDLAALGYEMVASKQEYSLGKLTMYHGHELPKGLTNPVNIARGLYLRTQEAGLTSHWHRTSTHTETSARKGRMVVCYSIGCLCFLKPPYGPVNSWNHGFATIEVAADGTYEVENKTILDGKVY